ncbi:hypothetical protein [Corallococcus aberystwythensis]|uniref:Uncharacterized protein n=1 Tax=Corallococcus aberystwythensis TaxID=2316722 RepID=A0A3A8QDS8_9BACT|nr:hypothetical protein [Corallococcus aberystwythensis]RKH61374.1 hypothetical protein D7W81_24030 [Corallococcus aberystwythensis]
MAGKKLEGYGSTSEQRQRHLENDAFSERAPRTPEELEKARSDPDHDGHQVVTLHPLDPDRPDDER